LVGKRALVNFSGRQKSIAEIGKYDSAKNKHYMKYVGEEEDNEYLDLVAGEKTWELIN
jgi:hypothetical protein